ncbi:unnamed protein product [Ilex paraguariensis]|uniref:KOW domain-containing protein n=1 Tax=Ilex paraguariensis TaxID=185542 RepID=A0ABC8RL72_9AQUA
MDWEPDHVDFIVERGADLKDEEDGRRMHRSLLPREDDQENVEALERNIQARGYKIVDGEMQDFIVERGADLKDEEDGRRMHRSLLPREDDQENVEALERNIQARGYKIVDGEMQETSLEEGSILPKAEAIKGMHIFDSAKIILVPIKEMTDVLSIESKTVDHSNDAWVKMKTGTYKGDLAKVLSFCLSSFSPFFVLIMFFCGLAHLLTQQVTLIQEGREAPKKKAITPPRFMNIAEARQNQKTGDYFENIEGMMFKDGFLYKTVSMKSISIQNNQPSLDELENFWQPGENGDDDMASLSTLFTNRKKAHFMKGNRVLILKGDLKNLKGCVKKVEEDTSTVVITDEELCKHFEPRNHVKVVSGAIEGATVMVVSVEGHRVNILSDATKEIISEVTSGITRIGDYEIHDVVLLDNLSFGVVICIQSEAF